MTVDIAIGHVQLDQTGRIAQDIHCIDCGYNLRSLLPDQKCPECNQPVEPSLHGEMLCFRSPVWLRKLAWGMTWLIIGSIFMIVFFVLQFTLRPLLQVRLGTGTIAVSVVEILAYSELVAVVIGVWLVTWPDPRTQGNSSLLGARVLARIILVASYIQQYIPWRTALPWHPARDSIGSTILWLGPSIIWSLGWICLYVHLARLARRIPATVLVWLTYAGVAVMIISFCFGVGCAFWQRFNIAAGRLSIAPPWICALEWCLPLAYMVLLLAAQIFYRMQFRRALRQSRQYMQEANAQFGASG